MTSYSRESKLTVGEIVEWAREIFELGLVDPDSVTTREVDIANAILAEDERGF